MGIDRKTLEARFIPARAGNTGLGGGAGEVQAVHPRAGGEHGDAGMTVSRMTGSSPRGRGTQIDTAIQYNVERFIPARAGNTRTVPPTLKRQTVHPRAGGEHLLRPLALGFSAGSSPRGRGTPVSVTSERRYRRFIPARAGNTAPIASTETRPSVHPRAGGEHCPAPRARRYPNGSSLRGRGTLRHSVWLISRLRFIPARAGNTSRGDRVQRTRAVHPRAGGEHLSLTPATAR